MDEADELLADAIEDCFVRAAVPDRFLQSDLFDRIQLKLMDFVTEVYNNGYKDGWREHETASFV